MAKEVSFIGFFGRVRFGGGPLGERSSGEVMVGFLLPCRAQQRILYGKGLFGKIQGSNSQKATWRLKRSKFRPQLFDVKWKKYVEGKVYFGVRGRILVYIVFQVP